MPRQRQHNRSGLPSNNNRGRFTQQASATVRTRQLSDMGSDRQFMFIEQDTDRGISSEAIRVHVMRESHRARRQLRGLTQSQESQGRMTILPTVPQTSTRPSRESSANPRDRTPPAAQEGAQANQTRGTSTALRRSVEQQFMEGVNDAGEHEIQSPALEILRSLPSNIVALCGTDTGALNALLALISAAQTSADALQAIQYESAALEVIRVRIEDVDGSEHLDGTILTVFLLSLLGRAKDNDEVVGFHESALAKMIEARGGLQGLQRANIVLAGLLRKFNLVNES